MEWGIYGLMGGAFNTFVLEIAMMQWTQKMIVLSTVKK